MTRGRKSEPVRVRNKGKTCYADQCQSDAKTRGLCRTHYVRFRRNGDPNKLKGKLGENNPKWRGGKSSHPLYLIYNDMKKRCINPGHKRYSDYGGRGISVHPEWVDDFWAFVRDVGERPEGKTQGGRAYWQLDRIDNDGHYEPGNVRWASPSEQALNKRGFGNSESRRDLRTGRYA